MYANRVFGRTLYYANFELSSDSSLSHRLRNITSVRFCSGFECYLIGGQRRLLSGLTSLSERCRDCAIAKLIANRY